MAAGITVLPLLQYHEWLKVQLNCDLFCHYICCSAFSYGHITDIASCTRTTWQIECFQPREQYALLFRRVVQKEAGPLLIVMSMATLTVTVSFCLTSLWYYHVKYINGSAYQRCDWPNIDMELKVAIQHIHAHACFPFFYPYNTHTTNTHCANTRCAYTHTDVAAQLIWLDQSDCVNCMCMYNPRQRCLWSSTHMFVTQFPAAVLCHEVQNPASTL